MKYLEKCIEIQDGIHQNNMQFPKNWELSAVKLECVQKRLENIQTNKMYKSHLMASTIICEI